MKNQTTEKLLLSLVLCGLGFTCLGFTAVEPRCPANPPQNETQAEKAHSTRLRTRPANPPQNETQAEKPTQLGYGRASQPCL